jgi:hypothetical protein
LESAVNALLFVLMTAAATQAPPASVTRQQFRAWTWIEGKWRGSGGNYPSFFEEYRFINDSTMRMRSFSDSTLLVPTDSSLIEWRGGKVQSRGGSSTTPAVTFTPTSVRFMPPGATAGGYTFTRVSNNEWTATLHPAKAGGRETVYTMRRIKP